MSALAVGCLCVGLGAGLWPFGQRAPVEEVPTIGTLEPRAIAPEPGPVAPASARRAIEGYRRFLSLPGGDPAMRAEALRRLGDLMLAAGIEAQASDAAAGGEAYFAEAIELYGELLREHPAQADRDLVIYQLGRALEGAGRGDESLGRLDELVGNYPQSAYYDEAQFRRGEILFVRQDYRGAERAYAAVVATGPPSAFFEQALYKQGWSLFKLARYEAGVARFLDLLDRRLAAAAPVGPADPLAAMSRPDRELVEDTLRVVSITFSYLDGAGSIARTLAARADTPYAYLLYAALGDLYLEKDRYRDAAATYEAFVADHPDHEQAPRLQEAVIRAYAEGEFPSLVLAAKAQFVERYGFHASFWQARTPDGYPETVAALKQHLSDLAAHDHALAQASGAPEAYERAARWYRRFLDYFPEDPDSAQRSFLLGELLFEAGRFDEATAAYVAAAYDYGPHPQAAEAGYAGLLAARRHEERLRGEARLTWHAGYIDQALRFANAFPLHPETVPVLSDVAEDLFASGQLERAIGVAGQVVTRQPPAEPRHEEVAWTVIAHAQFDLGRFAEAEQAYARLRLLPLAEPKRAEVEARVAASIYRQAEQAQAAGAVDAAVGHFLRLGEAVPTSELRATAVYDASALLLAAERWAEAAELLYRFRREFPAHEFNAQVTPKLAVALENSGRAGEAAAEFERLAADETRDADTRHEALWRAATLYADAGRRDDERRAYASLVAQFPAPFPEAMEARQKLADLASAALDWPDRRHWLEQIITADGTAGAARTDRSRFLASRAALELAHPLRDAFLAVGLTIPLDESLKAKKSRMELALAAYGRAAEYGVAEVTTAATFAIAEIYYRLARELIDSPRPPELGAEELEQYEILLEEQAFPFEEQAIELYGANAARAGEGVYDPWVQASFARLAELLPARYARNERSEHVGIWFD